ncbi:Glycoside hydrolase family 43 [Penicillium cinerascens]|uniref:Glycoside hydrolase family 43 n=1 Tax=Penicillium cinerascens TaxID=70096 RepID=A0A9W9J8L4_9EURO|nr:Glycoside hydrolase family 43 [Penicillium cinerascens]KAJ5191271.1 Glycoside hydrolase family 43 [Penicillium cinerascens]
MAGFFAGRLKRPDVRPTPSVQSLSDSHLSGSENGQTGLEGKPLTDLEGGGKTKSIFSRPWTRRDLTILGILGALSLALLALIIALPIVFVKGRERNQNEIDGDSWTPYRPKHNSPSYHIEENAPIWAIHDFPDPGLLEYNGTWYAFGTNPHKNDPNSIHIPVATSNNFVNWTLVKDHDALPTIGNWERKVNHWAPDVIRRDDGKFVMYYAGEAKDFGTHHCIGAAVSEGEDPIGPYVPLNESIACPHKYGGAIDPSPFRDEDGTMYVVYKGDGNSVGSGGYCGNSRIPRHSVPIMLQEVKSDGITLVGEPTIILDINKTDGPLVEAPDIIRTEDGTYYLFFSSHCFTSLGYNVKYAHAKSVKGPYTRAPQPLLQTGDFGLKAPGGATVSTDGKRMVFHANCEGWRCMYASAIDIQSNNNTIIMASLELQVLGNSTTHTINSITNSTTSL